MISGEWTGTMNLTEPQAGSDLALVRTRAEPQRRRPLQDLRHQDLHHLRRARHGREHRPPRAGARGRRARGREGHQPVHRARSSWSTPTASLGARNDVLASASSTSSASRPARPRCCSSATRAAATVRASAPDRRGEPRPRVHVHHDERGALRGRHAGHRGRRARLPAGRGLREGARAVAPGRRLGRRQRDRSSTTPTCAAC